jgi:glycosyltransferase involved in cell wall biosynthesis
MIPHDIKAVAQRKLGHIKIPYYKYLLYLIMYEMDFKHADKIIAISDFDQSQIIQYYRNYKDKITRIYNPIVVNKRVKDVNNQEKYICALNVQFHHKNIITLIKAFELIKDKTDCSLLLMGTVPKRVEYLQTYVKEHQLENYIKFTGFIEENILNYKFANCVLYVNPTLYEGFGMTAVEAVINKVPTLLSDIPTNIEVTKGMCEYYGPAENEKVLADRILECLNKKYNEEELVRKSQAMIDEYNYLNISRKYLNLFEE